MIGRGRVGKSGGSGRCTRMQWGHQGKQFGRSACGFTCTPRPSFYPGLLHPNGQRTPVGDPAYALGWDIVAPLALRVVAVRALVGVHSWAMKWSMT